MPLIKIYPLNPLPELKNRNSNGGGLAYFAKSEIFKYVIPIDNTNKSCLELMSIKRKQIFCSNMDTVQIYLFGYSRLKNLSDICRILSFSDREFVKGMDIFNIKSSGHLIEMYFFIIIMVYYSNIILNFSHTISKKYGTLC